MATAEATTLPLREDEEATSSRGAVARVAMYMALAAAWIAMCGSLYMSEVLGWTPCTWCWYQRIAMYPLAVILAAGLTMRDRNVPKYALCLAVPGSLAAIYHILLQKVPAFTALETCKVGVPCSADYLNLFGFITIPMLALTAFVIIIIASVIALRTTVNIDENYLSEGPLLSLSPIVSVILVVAAIVALFVLSGVITISRRPPASISSSIQISSLGQPASPDVAASLYSQSCASCHGPANASMQFVRADYLNQHSDLEVMTLIRAGRNATALDNFSGQAMPANGGRIDLTDEQLLALVRYLREVKGS